MNSRERRMVLVLALCLLAGAAFAAYALVFTPIQDLKTESEKVETDISIKQSILDKVLKDQKRADAAKKRSLPADPDLAQVEYDLMMRKFLNDAGVPQGFTIVPRPSLDTKGIPVFDPKTKKPVYSKIGFEIHMKKVDLATVARFLQDYYRLNLLQQITFLNIVRKDQDGVGSRSRAGGDRTDLDVKIHTEAVILDGAQDRRTLLPISLAKAAVGGGPGYATLLYTREAGRSVSPLQLADVLASSKSPRDYLHMSGRDFIHGPLPPPPPPETPKVEDVVKAPEKPKEDISPFIKLTGAFVGSDGVAEASVWDQANNQLYVITLKPKGERYEVKVEKLFLVNEKWKRVLDGLWTELVIHEDDTATSRKFKVVGLDGLDLVLTETRTLAPEPTKSESGKPRPVAKPTGKMPPPPPSAAVVGGSAALTPAGEKVYVWRVGQTLQSLTALPVKDAEEALCRAAPSFRTAVTEPTTPTSAPLSKID